jgi:acetyltransferase EpsM
MFGILGVNPISIIIVQIAKDQFNKEDIIYIDDNPEKLHKLYNEVEVRSNTDNWETEIKKGANHLMAICLGEKYLARRKELFHRFNKYANLQFPVIKHNTCTISNLATIEDGNILSFGVIISHNSHLKCNSVFWSGVVIEHDSIIGESCYIAPNVTISGFVNIGDCTLIGSGAVIMPEIKIGRNCLIGAGAVVTKDIPDYSVVAGVPAKIIRSCK